MTRRLTTAHLEELRRLRDRAVLTIDFVRRRSDLGEFGGQMLAVIETTFAKQDLRGLRVLSRDVTELAQGMAPQDVKELESLMARELGVDLPAEAETENQEILAIASRGRIRNEREHRLVAEYLDRASADSEPALRLTLEQLLGESGPFP